MKLQFLTILSALTCSTVLSLGMQQDWVLAHPGQSNPPTPSTHHPLPAAPTHNGDQHPHRAIEISTDQPVPTVKLVVHRDAVQGINLEVKVAHFNFAPERVNQTSLTTEGHAHLYVDGQKVTRLYGPWYYLGNLTPGQHRITVTLNTNGHQDLTHQGKAIQATEIIEVPALPSQGL